MAILTEDHPDLSFVAIEKATVPPGEHIRNSWWVVHPEKGIVYWREFSPQCNTNKEIAERIKASMYPWAELRFLPSVYRRINPNDYV